MTAQTFVSIISDKNSKFKKLLAFLRKSVALIIEGNSNQFIVEKDQMLRNFTILIFVLLVAAVASVNIYAQKTANTTKDEAAIRGIVEQMVKGWSMKSGAEFAKPFAEDSHYVVINGFHIKGRAANAASHQQIFDTIFKNTSLMLTVEQIRFVRPDVAIVHVSGSRKPTKQADSSTPIVNARITMVMVKNDGKWEIAAFQNTGIQAAAAGGK
jgi:uncharacterized protein (TIGR02246 family)